MIAGSALLLLLVVLVLAVPAFRESARGPAWSFDNKTPVGRGSVRAWSMRMLMLGVISFAALIASIPGTGTVGATLALWCAALLGITIVLQITLTFFNWPRILAPKKLRNAPGAVQEWRKQFKNWRRARRK
jgi:hypothetical protein